MSKNYLKIVIISFVSLLGCNEDEFKNLENFETPRLDLRENLSTIDFENFVIQNKDFQILVNDTLIVEFKDIVIPLVETPDEDVVYNTYNGKGSITFGIDGEMYFLYSDNKISLKGSLYNALYKENEARLELQKSLRKKMELSKVEENKFTLIEPQGGYELIEIMSFIPAQKELQNIIGRRNLSTINSNECYEIENDDSKYRSIALNNKINDGVIKVKVFTLKKLPDRDIQFAKIYTRNSLKSAYANNNVFERKVKTYFNKTLNGGNIVNFSGDKTNSDTYLDSWLVFAYFNNNDYAPTDNKYLLLTDFSIGSTLGRAYMANSIVQGKVGWAQVDGKSHSTPGHEVGHMFGAEHTYLRPFQHLPFWPFIISKADIMCPNRMSHFVINSNIHEIESNREAIRDYIDGSTN